MIILVDAYNLLKQLFGPIISEQQRAQYVTMLNGYATMKHHTIILVFDGGFFEYSVREKQGNVVSMDVGKHQTADQVILEYIAQHAKKEVLVVSSDRALTDCASKHGLVSLDSMLFNTYVKQAFEKQKTLLQSEKITKLHPEDKHEEVDALMEQSTLSMPQKSDDQIIPYRTMPSSQLSKRERKIMAILKKL